MTKSFPETVWIKPSEYIQRNATVTERKVTKVGRLYFEVEGLPRVQFEVETFKQKPTRSGYGFNYTCWPSLDKYHQSIEERNDRERLRQCSGWIASMPIEHVRAMLQIIDDYKTTTND